MCSSYTDYKQKKVCPIYDTANCDLKDIKFFPVDCPVLSSTPRYPCIRYFCVTSLTPTTTSSSTATTSSSPPTTSSSPPTTSSSTTTTSLRPGKTYFLDIYSLTLSESSSSILPEPSCSCGTIF